MQLGIKITDNLDGIAAQRRTINNHDFTEVTKTNGPQITFIKKSATVTCQGGRSSLS